MSKILLTARVALCLLCCLSLKPAIAQNEQVETVYVVFKTHLDVGFTDLSSVVTERYIREFIPRAVELSEKLAAEQAQERYVWTTGSWLVWKYLQTAPGADRLRLEAAIRRGDIVWNGVPYTVETETMSRDLFETTLLLAKRLDSLYDKRTIAAKMTDVPGHTRGIVGPLADAGIQLLQIGVNPASQIPAVPPVCRWRDSNGKEIILMYQQDYGSDEILPGGRTAVSVNFTGDNHGPHSYEQVKAIYDGLRKKYPNARLVPGSFNEIAADLVQIRDSLPVVTSEIGDTWIYGYGSAPARMAKYRALSALYSCWLAEGRIERKSNASLDFAVELGLIAEHTQGMDVKTHLANWDKYDIDAFTAARGSAPFRQMEQSWTEIDHYLNSAIGYLPPDLQQEARTAMQAAGKVTIPEFTNKNQLREFQDNTVSFHQTLLGERGLTLSGITYRAYDQNDYDRYLKKYLRSQAGWAYDDLGKTGLKDSKAAAATVKATIVHSESRKEQGGVWATFYELAFPNTAGIDRRVYPAHIYLVCRESGNRRETKIELTIQDKPAVRLPESYWISFSAEELLGIVAEKTGERIDLLDVVERGNRRMHGIDRYVDITTSHGTFRIWSPTASLVELGEPCGIGYDTTYPDSKGGIHFNLSNNLWGTNFTMWSEGSITYRFRIERLPKAHGKK